MTVYLFLQFDGFFEKNKQTNKKKNNNLTVVMVNFMDQLDWALGSPDSWLNIILSVSVRIFLDEIDDESRLLSITWWPHSISRRREWNKKNGLY